MAGDVVAHAAEAAHHGVDLVPIVALLAAGTIAVPLFKRLGLGAVLGYLAAGLLLGPGVLSLVREIGVIHMLSEIGVALLLFSIGL